MSFILWGSITAMLCYLEIVYHVSGFGWSVGKPIFSIMLILAWSSAEAMLVGVVRGKIKKFFYYGFLWGAVLWTIAQIVYLRIFRQPLLWEAVFRGGKDALTHYWREALGGVWVELPYVLLAILPVLLISITIHIKKWDLPDFKTLQVLRILFVFVVGVSGCIVTSEVEKAREADFYEEYTEFFDPLTIAEEMGMWPVLHRDTMLGMENGVNDFVQALYDKKAELTANGNAITGEEVSFGDAFPPQEESSADGADEEDKVNGGAGGQTATAGEQAATEGQTAAEGQTATAGQTAMTEEQIASTGENQATAGESDDTDAGAIREQKFNLDFEKLAGLADNKKQAWLAEYLEGMTPTTTNEYTGIFEGYNLIYLTAEGFSTYAIDEELTPTLYRLTHSGFIFENYYVPIWQTSTSDGEYINCTGLIPDGQFSMKKSSENEMAYTLPRFFEQEGVNSYAYHNNSLSYYDRYLTHPNLGYDFKGCKLGSLSESEWGDQVFYMENPNAWPASDLEMMQGTVSEYIHEERFHVYYMTVSGHMNYNFQGNAMSAKNREAVQSLDMSENARAYIACNMELDKALEYLLTELEAAGQLEKTVICLSADHYPYGMTTEQYEELAGRTLTEGMDLYRNSLILWNVGMEEEPVVVDKVCGSMDIVPTLLNLFGFSFDSGMYAGRDIFSDQEGLVIFNDRSFVTDACIYSRRDRTTIWTTDEEGRDIIPDEEKEAYLEAVQQDVKDRYQFSAYVLREDYYQDIVEAIIPQN